MNIEETPESIAAHASLPREFERRVMQQALVAGFGRFALRGGDFDAMLQEACRVAAEGVGVQLAKVSVPVGGGAAFRVCAGVGWSAGVVGTTFTGGELENPTSYAFHTGEPVISNHLSLERQFRTPQVMAEHGVVRALNVLIRGDGEPYGVLETDSRDPGAFSPHDVDFMQALANTLGLALERERALQNKRLMAREIDHRIKNSLMLVGSVLAMQRRAATSEEARAALASAADRVHTIARIHERLHISDTADSVEFGAYLGDLARDMVSSRPEVELVLEVEPVDLPSDRAAPLGLVAAELLMNALKHAGQGASVIRVGFRRLDGSLELVVADDGPGLPPDFDPARSRGLGMRLVVSLVAQLDGTLEAGSGGDGARFVLRAPVQPPR